MNLAQRKVAIGAASGVLSMGGLIAFLFHFSPDIVGISTVTERLVLTLQWNIVAVIPFFVMLIAVGNGRFLSDAIDPTKHLETKSIEINGRVADNTLQQNFVFFIGTMALAPFLNDDSIKIIPVLVGVFVLARIVFWVGYRIHPLYRAPGMAATSYMNLGILLSSLYFLIHAA